MKFQITNRWSGLVQFEAEIECGADASVGVKVGLAVRWARTNKADLRGAILRGAILRDAILSGADLSGADLRGAVLRDADLRDADLRGADLSGADLRDADLRVAVLSGAALRDADLSGADLSGADLRDADLRVADLSGAALRDAILSGDLLAGVPRIPNIHQTIYEAARQPDALDMGTWHCGTSHCRAGWVVTLAGDGGRALEWGLKTPAAAAIIYLASDPKIERIPDFYASNEAALEDMKRLAEAELSATTDAEGAS